MRPAGIKKGRPYAARSLSKNPRVDKGPQPPMFNPALTTCASERMKTQRFSYVAIGADRAIGASTECKKLEKVAFSHFFDSLRRLSRRHLSLSVICIPTYELPQYGCWRYLVLYVRVQYVIQEFHYIPGHGIVLALRRHLLKKGIDVLLKHGHLIE